MTSTIKDFNFPMENQSEGKCFANFLKRKRATGTGRARRDLLSCFAVDEAEGRGQSLAGDLSSLVAVSQFMLVILCMNMDVLFI